MSQRPLISPKQATIPRGIDQPGRIVERRVSRTPELLTSSVPPGPMAHAATGGATDRFVWRR